MNVLRSRGTVGLLLILMAGSLAPLISSVTAQTGTEFSGTVLTVDPAAGKLAVKKEGGGTRFTFVTNDKTTFEGAGLRALADLKKGDAVTVTYVTTGSQYVAQRVTRK
jgi:hypothetical protein